jgi:hypothetical protein
MMSVNAANTYDGLINAVACFGVANDGHKLMARRFCFH